MKTKKVLAIASTGGHWLQLQRLRPAFEGCRLTFISTADYQDQLKEKQYTVKDASQWDKPGLILMALQIFFLLLKIRPDVIVTTGAAPGFFALVFGKIMGKKTMWIDSIANGEAVSLSGKKAKPFADKWLSQWPEVAEKADAEYKGAVL
jgi:UDP-N-acetylglucosamine:LPS N-acetylglucosamine transferase